jgi:hypothetical protein
MTDIQKQFLELAVIKQVEFDKIPLNMDIDRKTVSLWWNELKNEREKLSELRQIWKKKFKKNDFENFFEWYDKTDKKCCYCNISEDDISILFKNNKIVAKSGRGKKLEFERKIPDLPYDDLKNLTFACYWCNNAKTDTFSFDEFLPVGKEIEKIWKKRLEK